MIFDPEKKLSCGHRLSFVPWPGLGKGQDLAHQKTPATIMALGDYFSTWLVRPRNIVEIGVARGGGLALWADAFPEANVIGIEKEAGTISPTVDIHLQTCLRGKVEVRQALMPDSVVPGPGPFDIIVDDANHDYELIIANFDLLWPRVAAGGVYIIDDWRTDAGKPEALAMRLARHLIGGYWPSEAGPVGAPFRVSMYRGLVAITRRL